MRRRRTESGGEGEGEGEGEDERRASSVECLLVFFRKDASFISHIQ